MANRQRRIFIKTANKFQQVASNLNTTSQSLSRKSGRVNTATIILKLPITSVFGLSLTIAAHYDKGVAFVFLAYWTLVTALLFAASSIEMAVIHDRNE